MNQNHDSLLFGIDTALVPIQLHLQFEGLEVLLTAAAADIVADNSGVAFERIGVLGVVPRGQRGPLGVERVVQDPGSLEAIV